MFLNNVLNPVGEQEPDLPSIKCDSLPMSMVIPRSSTRDRAQFVAGHIDGTVRLYTARPASEWWKPQTYDEEDIGLYEDDDEDGEISEDDEVAQDAFETSWSVKQSLLPVRAIDLFPNNHHYVACATREGGVGVIDMETHKSLVTNLDHNCGYSTLKAWDDNLILLGDEEGACVGLDLRCNIGKGTTINKPLPGSGSAAAGKMKIDTQIPPAGKTSKNNPILSTSPPSSSTTNSFTLEKKWNNDDFGDYITSMCISTKHKQVIFGSSDKHISSYDLRSGKYLDTGKNFDEINSLCLIKDDELVLTGSDVGPLSTFPIKNMELMKDRYLFQDKSVDFIVPLDDDTVLTGTEDGIIRLLTVNPTRIIGVVAVHKAWLTAIATQRGALEQDDFVWANDLVCCASADNVVRFWDVQDMQVVRQNLTRADKKALDKKRALAYDSDNDDDAIKSSKKKQKNNTKTAGKNKKKAPQFDDTTDEDIDWSDDKKDGRGKKSSGNKMADSDDDSDFSEDGDDFNLESDDAMQAFLNMASDYQEVEFAKDQERLRKKYLSNLPPQQQQQHQNQDQQLNVKNQGKKQQKLVSGDIDSENEEEQEEDGNIDEDTTDFDWDNEEESTDDRDFENDDDGDDDDDDDDDEVVEGIDWEALDKMTEAEQDEYMKKMLGADGSDLEDLSDDADLEDFGSDMSDDDDDGDDGKMDFSQIKNVRQVPSSNNKNKADEKIPKPEPKANANTNKNDKNAVKKIDPKDSKKQPIVKKDGISQKDEKNNTTTKDKQNVHAKKDSKNNPNQEKPLLPPPGPRIMPVILDATTFDHKKFRKAHNHDLADANRSGFYAEKAQKRKDKKALDLAVANNEDLPKAVNGLTELPNIQHKLPTVRKLKHGTSNFFNGL